MSDTGTHAITYCAVNPNHKYPTAPAHLCENCDTNLGTWLREIPTAYALLPGFVNHGSADKNPDSKTTKASEAQAPMRLDIIDLLDTRLGRKWQGTETTPDRRGVYGTLLAIAANIHDARNLTGELPTTVTTTCGFIERHRLWLTAQEWVDEPHAELKHLHRAINDAVGIYRQRPVGRCYIHPEDAATPCGGPLYPNTYTGVHCARCHATWDAEQLRILGLALNEQEQPA